MPAGGRVAAGFCRGVVVASLERVLLLGNWRNPIQEVRSATLEPEHPPPRFKLSASIDRPPLPPQTHRNERGRAPIAGFMLVMPWHEQSKWRRNFR